MRYLNTCGAILRFKQRIEDNRLRNRLDGVPGL